MEMPPLLWGTNRTRPSHAGGVYRGRVHIVRPGPLQVGWCGLPVDAVWPQRPPTPQRAVFPICPECSVAYLAETYPVEPGSSAQTQTMPAVNGAGGSNDEENKVAHADDQTHRGDLRAGVG
jgi:hypothetical protein